MSERKLKRPLVALLLSPDQTMWEDAATGRKKITIREGHRDYIPGEKVMLCCEIRSDAMAADITSVRHCTVGEVTPEEYHADKYASPEHMLSDLGQYYPNLTMDSPVTVIRWDNVRGTLVNGIAKK